MTADQQAKLDAAVAEYKRAKDAAVAEYKRIEAEILGGAA